MSWLKFEAARPEPAPDVERENLMRLIRWIQSLRERGELTVPDVSEEFLSRRRLAALEELLRTPDEARRPAARLVDLSLRGRP